MNNRFAEYTTSGAFALNLTRNQVSTLAMLADGAEHMSAAVAASLERKGPAEPVARPTWNNPDHVEYRATAAGLLTASLTREAGLTNGPDDAMVAELTRLRAELERRRKETADAKRCARSALARVDRLQLECDNLKSRLEGDRPRVAVLIRDPSPEVTTEELWFSVGGRNSPSPQEPTDACAPHPEGRRMKPLPLSRLIAAALRRALERAEEQWREERWIRDAAEVARKAKEL